ncbi:MAG: IS5 family transposase [Chroococcidiopsidaceae cyanobacterium CP_BM_ER_R8_30]|nr:IS5 family transposase [Chroococcidiopsidaceae cyanobacterium CP_BM_ER_R8_30]
MPSPFYPSDLIDAEWEIITPLLPPQKQQGRQRQVDFREVVNAIFYRADNGIKWRAMPSEFPVWQTVYSYYRKWVKQGLWERINALLVEQVRSQSGRDEQPSLGMIDAQSVKHGQRGQVEQGVDGYKKVKGRKRHVVVDVLGLMLGCYVSAANAADSKAAPAVLVPVLELYKRLEKVLGDQGYKGELDSCLQAAYKCVLEIASPRKKKGFHVDSLRWIVERTFAWLDNARVLCRDYEVLPENHDGMICVVMIRLMLRRLSNNRRTRTYKTA